MFSNLDKRIFHQMSSCFGNLIASTPRCCVTFPLGTMIPLTISGAGLDVRLNLVSAPNAKFTGNPTKKEVLLFYSEYFIC